MRELRERLKEPQFNRKCLSIGAELEVYLVDDQFVPACVNEELLKLADNPCLTPEINRYNMEINLSSVEKSPLFSTMEEEMRCMLNMLQGHARSIGAHVIPIGILPTLQREHLGEEYMTNRVRYHALREALCGPDHKRYKINIKGKDHLIMEGSGVSVEGANTSFQVHLRVPTNQFVACFNAAQFATPLLLGLAPNSPLVVGHRLWQESRIALFKQSVDFRDHENLEWRWPSRVSFGQGWIRREAWELFAESVALHPPLLPVLFDRGQDEPYAFSELCLHHGTVWPWNRAVYGTQDGGHLRIEFRTLPAGPSVIDMMANAALAIGLTLGFADSMDHYSVRIPFRFVEYNFYRATQHGLNARLIWPNKGKGGFRERPIMEVIEEFLPVAREGLRRLETESTEIDRLWKIVEERFEKRITGAKWQLDRFEHYREKCSVEESCHRMLTDYYHNIMASKQVASWC